MRAWQRMLSGRRLDLINPAPVDVEIEDIAHGLSRVARWNGQTSGTHAFSVAQHSIIVENLAKDMGREMCIEWRLAALLHDAPEYVIGDMISPFKSALGIDYQEFEERLQKAIHIRFGIPPNIEPELKDRIKAADHASAWFEATEIAGFSSEEADKLFGPVQNIRKKPDVTPLPAEKVKDQFVELFHHLYSQI